MATPSKRYPLIQYLKVQNDYDKAVDLALKTAMNDIETQLSKLSGSVTGDESISKTVRRAQLQAQQAAIKSRISSLMNRVGNLTSSGQRDSVTAAFNTIDAYTDDLFGRASVDVSALVAAESERAAAGYNTMLARLSSSQRALSAQVYHTAALSNGWVDNLVNSALVKGSSWSELSKEVQKFIDPNVAGGVSYAAKRLARTEMNNAFHDATVQRYQDSIVVQGMNWNLSNSHPEGDECDELAANGPYAKDKVPQKPHPFCLCYLTPDVPSDEEFLNKLFAGEYDDALPEEAKLGGKSEGTGAPKWSDIVSAAANGNDDAFEIGLKNVYEGRDFNGFTIGGTTAWEPKGRGVLMEATIYDAEGNYAGTVSRGFHNGPEGTYVSHELMNLRSEARGKGFSSEFSKFSEAWYKENNFDHIEVHAALEDGGYAWARAGYVWDPYRYSEGSPPSEVYSQLKRLYEAPADQGFRDIGDANRAVLKGFMDRFTGPVSGWPTPAELAASGAEPVVGSTDTLKTGKTGRLGKSIMRGSNWFGVKYLK